jgi:hypothetical protein
MSKSSKKHLKNRTLLWKAQVVNRKTRGDTYYPHIERGERRGPTTNFYIRRFTEEKEDNIYYLLSDPIKDENNNDKKNTYFEEKQ